MERDRFTEHILFFNTQTSSTESARATTNALAKMHAAHNQASARFLNSERELHVPILVNSALRSMLTVMIHSRRRAPAVSLEARIVVLYLSALYR